MKKKLLALSLALAMALTATACGSGSSTSGSTDNSGSSDNSASAPADVPEAGEAASAEVTGDNMTISLFAGSLPENTPTGGALAVMADYINAYSNGTINAQAF